MGYVIGDETIYYDLVFKLTGGYFKCTYTDIACYV